MGADILDDLRQLAAKFGMSHGDLDVIDSAAAEIGRLRGEVKDLEMAWCGEPLDPAPAMPNGVESAISDADIAEWEAFRGEGMVSAVGEYTPQEFWWVLGELKRYRAADNRDAAGVVVTREMWEAGTSAYAEWVRQVYSRGMPTPEDRAEGRDIAIAAMHAAAPAAVPAGEAVARERSGVTAVFRICTAYEAGVGKGIQGRDVGNPYKPNTDEHEAWGYGFKQGRSVDEDEAELEFRPGDPDSPMPSQRAPAPVQAAPQEGEAMDRGPWRRKGARFYSDDFTHDVSLVVGGDFGSDEVEDRYLDWLLSVLNGPAGAALQHRGDSRGGEASGG